MPSEREKINMAEILLGGKKLPDLKVTELKAELDKRGLPKKGVKSVLIERLRKAILEELNSVEPAEVDDTEETDDSQLDVDTSHLDSHSGQMEDEQGAFTTDIVGDLIGRTESQTSEDNKSLPDDQAGDVAEAPPVEKVKGDEAEECAIGAPAEEAKTDTDKVAAEDEDGDVEPLRLEYEGTPEVMDDVAPEQEDVASKKEEEVVPHEGTPVMDEDPKDVVEKLMELTSPLNSSSEKMEDDDKTGKDKRSEEQEGDVAKAGEVKDEGKAMERLDSEIESSYSLDTEVLLYEGDVENEPEQERSTEKKDDNPLDDEGNEYGLIVNLHDDNMDIDVAPKIQPKAGGKKGSSQEARSQKNQEKQSGSDTRRKQPTDAPELPRSPMCHLWVCGLASTVRALDLQTLFSPVGQVISAKVVAKARSKKNRFGYVTMATPEQAQQCIKELSGMELKGSKITVEVAKSQPAITRPPDNKGKEPEASHHSPTSSTRKPSEKDQAVAASGEAKKEERDSKGGAPERSGGKPSDKPRRSTQSDKSHEESGQKRAEHFSGHGGYRGRLSLPGRRSRSRSPERTRLMRRSSPGSQRSFGSGRHPDRGRRRSRSPPRGGRGSHGGGNIPMRGDARHEIMRREAERREIERREMERRMGDPYLRERERQVEARLEERRIAHSRHQEMLMRRQLELEHTRREQEMAMRVQESRDRETRERELRERQLAEQERLFKERERELREREYRERQRRELLERELREREGRERELRERERRLREQHERETRERELKTQREQEIRVRMQAEKEKELRERERKLREEHEQIEQERLLYEEQQRRIQEEQERRAKEREELERRDRERRLREEKDRERQERERRERERLEEERAKREKREREEMMLQQQRLGKRPYGGDSVSYESAKRQAVHDVRSGSDGSYPSPSSVFGRLDPPTQNRSPDVPALLSRTEDAYRRGEPDRSRPLGASSFRSGGQSRDRHDAVAYPVPVASTSRSLPTSRSMQVPSSRAIPVTHQAGNVYGKAMMSTLTGGSVQEAMKARSGTSPAALSRVPPDIITAATQALENIRKTVATAGQVPGSRVSPQIRIGHTQTPTAVQLQQLAASARSPGSLPGFLPLNPRSLMVGAGLPPTRQPIMASPGGAGVSMVSGKPQHKLPPEDERYNRRLSRPQGQPHQVRPSAYKRLV